MATAHTAAQTREQLVAAAREIAPAIAERAADCETQRRLPAETIVDFRRAGLLRALVAPAYGGYGLEIGTVIETSREIARACGSSGWCLAICTLHTDLASGFPQAAREKIFAERPDPVICGVFMPSGTATRASDGWRLTGAWNFASTCDHADFGLFAAVINDPREGDPPVASFALRRDQFSIVDNWHTAGLCGTGSKQVVINDAVIADSHVMAVVPGTVRAGGGDRRDDGRLSAGLPGSSVATLGLAGVAMGIALGALDRFEQRLKGKLREGSFKDNDRQVAAQLRFSESASEVDVAELLVLRDLDEMTADTLAGRRSNEQQRARYRRDAAWAIQACARATARLQPAAGAGSIMLADPLQRAVRDAQTISAHVVADLDGGHEAWARAPGAPRRRPPQLGTCAATGDEGSAS